jgi:hypothetical protein
LSLLIGELEHEIQRESGGIALDRFVEVEGFYFVEVGQGAVDMTRWPRMT